MKLSKLWLWGLLLVLLLTAPVAGESLFTTGNRECYEVRQQVRLTKQGGTVINLQLEAPVFLKENLPPYQRLVSFSANLASLKMTRSETEPRVVYRLTRWRDQPEILLELVYIIENSAIEYRLRKYAGSNAVAPRYLGPEPAIESAAEPIVAAAAALSDREVYPLDKALKLFDYVNSQIKYEKNDGATHSALRTLRRGAGNCEDLSLLYIALCRAAGIPARFVNGFRFDPTVLKTGVNDLDQFGHAWVELNLPGIGWVSVEPTYTYTVNGAPQVNYDFFGKLRADDRHLLFNYSRNGGSRCSWSHDRRTRVQVKMDTRMTIRRIK